MTQKKKTIEKLIDKAGYRQNKVRKTLILDRKFIHNDASQRAWEDAMNAINQVGVEIIAMRQQAERLEVAIQKANFQCQKFASEMKQ